MFKTAATKIAHNSTLPALGGNQDLRPLQDLITAEKAVLISLQKLSLDYSKAAEALRTWGLNEGDDLGDILSASTTILSHFSTALSQYATHGHAMRDHLKSIRTREEGLDELKRRRRTVSRKAEDAEKKLSKMSSEHKNIGTQNELLNHLRDEIRTMDSDIMSEEAAVGDFKRTASRMWLGLKFGGLLECCEKGTIVAEFGKTAISEIPEDITQPGLPRSLYYGHSKTENIVSEVSRCVNDVVLSVVPTVGFRDRRKYDQNLPDVSQQNFQQTGYQLPNEGYGMGPGSRTPTDNKPQPPPPMQGEDISSPQKPYVSSGAPGSPAASFGGSFANYPYIPNQQRQGSGPGYDSRTMPPRSNSPLTLGTIDPRKNVDDFGMNTGSGPFDNTPGGRFATFPVKNRPAGQTGYSLHDQPSLNARHDYDQSLSASIAEALETTTQDTSHATDTGHTEGISSRWGRVNNNPPPPHIAEPTIKGPIGNQSSSSYSRPGMHTNGLPTSPAPAANNIPTPSRLPPLLGAAAPDLSDPWASASLERSMQAPSHTRDISQISDNDDALLAYMTVAQEEEPLTEAEGATVSKSPVASVQNSFKAARPTNDNDQQRISRHVKFGGFENVEEEMKNRLSLEKESKPEETTDIKRLSLFEAIPSVNQDEGGPAAVSSQKSNDREISPARESTKHRMSPPADDETALNAAAAREITLELEALNATPINLPDINNRGKTEPSTERGRLTAASGGYSVDSGREPSPLAPPSAPFTKRTVSPHPYSELNKNAPYGSQSPYSPSGTYTQTNINTPTPYAPPANISPAQAYAQAYQSSRPRTPEAHGPSPTLPLRFQPRNQSTESQVPPRFQTSQAHSTGPPNSSQPPPRFQTSGSTEIPPAVNLVEQRGTVAEPPYRTPPEYPRPLGVSSAYTRSNSSLNTTGSPTAPVSSTARTISAAAFKRPRNPSADNPGDPFAKKGLPTSPYLGRDASGPVALHAPTLTAAPAENEEDEYDYISAYVNNSNPNSPHVHKTSFDTTPSQEQGGGNYRRWV